MITYRGTCWQLLTTYFLHTDQNNGDLRLVGTGLNNGRLEIYISSECEWGTVCDDFFNQRAGDIVCRQLGFLFAAREGNVRELGYV